LEFSLQAALLFGEEERHSLKAELQHEGVWIQSRRGMDYTIDAAL
jgi:hypothetical protein